MTRTEFGDRALCWSWLVLAHRVNCYISSSLKSATWKYSHQEVGLHIRPLPFLPESQLLNIYHHTTAHVYIRLIYFWQGTKVINSKDSLFNDWCWENWISTGKENESQPLACTTYTKITATGPSTTRICSEKCITRQLYHSPNVMERTCSDLGGTATTAIICATLSWDWKHRKSVYTSVTTNAWVTHCTTMLPQLHYYSYSVTGW